MLIYLCSINRQFIKKICYYSKMIEQIRKSVMLFNAPIQRVYKANRGTIIRTVIYTIGHFVIAAACVMYFTGAEFKDAVTDAVVEPLLNSVWYFVLDKFWASRYPQQ